MMKLAFGAATRHAGTYIAGLLLANGFISDSQVVSIASIVASVLAAGGMYVWSLLHKTGKVSA